MGIKKGGQGVFRWADGRGYEGQCKAGNREGQGVYRWADGSVYEGQWKADKKEGQGVCRWADGSVEAGPYMAGSQSRLCLHGLYTTRYLMRSNRLRQEAC